MAVALSKKCNKALTCFSHALRGFQTVPISSSFLFTRSRHAFKALSRSWNCLEARSYPRLSRGSLDPDSEGKFGQVVFFDSDYQVAILVADSLSELFENFLIDLESGHYELLPEALDDGVHWLEGKGELNIINWYHSPKWSFILDSSNK